MAAFRIGHSLLRPHIPRMSPTYQPVEPALLLRDVFFNPDVIYKVFFSFKKVIKFIIITIIVLGSNDR